MRAQYDRATLPLGAPLPIAHVPHIDAAALNSCVRDLVALSTMPALWIGRPPVAIAESVRDLLVGMLRPDSVYVQLQDRAHGHTHVATAHGKGISTIDRRDETIYRDVTSEPLLLDTEIALGLASLPIGLDGEMGRVAVGSSRPHFPTTLELLLIQVAANQIAVALQHTELLSRHQQMEQALEAARAEAEKSSRLKSEFLGMMSHELRTPLNAIGGYVQLMEDGIRGPVTAEQQRDLGRIRRSQQHLLSVIENVLGYLKLGAGRVSYTIGIVPLEDIAANVEDITRPLMESKELAYERRAPTEHLFARADREKVQQIVLNLLSNAIKFTDGGGRVTLEWAASDSAVFTRVHDSGCGIPSDRLENIFEPFVQVDSSRTRPHGGTGLGLSISRDFAEGMGGKLYVESELGKGSIFTLVLPQAAGA
ncbi:MAG TPA: HAMP domain-containing sensor histidine kinase [Gemmatimonadaceae bacterium]|jgi:signal transduction histidine kinase|nr:HAMP domain-containing sensor histidine kinase [Gemmatimonadaceae bacterium]